MTRALVLYAHPCGDSFAAALHQTVVGTLTERGWEVDDCDLYKEGFNPALSEAERRGYHDEPANIEPVKDYVGRLRACDALVLCFPVWNFGYPAILKGFFDRVFLPGVSFKIVNGKVAPNLTHVKRTGRRHDLRRHPYARHASRRSPTNVHQARRMACDKAHQNALPCTLRYEPRH